ncbi:MAG: response regulator transcription factor, partial [Candidatus Sericytochromatia bacterium]|nr:response regulator transcription factor [Candidatus Tanganyikabacteria bacterium]
MASIWVAEDDPEFLELYKFLLDREGFAVEAFDDGQRLLDAMQRGSPDLLLLDLGLPGVSGLEILAAFKADPRHAATPVLVATASTQVADKYRSLCLADDYLAKPFDPIEFVLRVKARLRAAGSQESPDFIRGGSLTLNCALHEVDVHGGKVALTPSEFEILKYLMERPHRPVSVDVLLTE